MTLDEVVTALMQVCCNGAFETASYLKYTQKHESNKHRGHRGGNRLRCRSSLVCILQSPSLYLPTDASEEDEGVVLSVSSPRISLQNKSPSSHRCSDLRHQTVWFSWNIPAAYTKNYTVI